MKKLIFHILTGGNIASIVALLAVGFSGLVDPSRLPSVANASLAFPFVLALNVAFIPLWLLVRGRMVWLPVVGLAVAFEPVQTYCPVSVPHEAPEGALTVMSYNVFGYGYGETHERPNPIVAYLASHPADIVCLQEADVRTAVQADIDSLLAPIYHYRDTALSPAGGGTLAIFSRLPIAGHEHIRYASRGNHSVAYRVVAGRDTLLVINNHLESTGLDMDDRREFREVVKGETSRREASAAARRIYGKLGAASSRRSSEAEAVAAYADSLAHLPTIICGDFNDGPLSYAHRTIQRGRTDCFTAAGNGPGISYHRGGMYVRIDNIICSRHFTPYACRVDNSVKASDHYPIRCALTRE